MRRRAERSGAVRRGAWCCAAMGRAAENLDRRKVLQVCQVVKVEGWPMPMPEPGPSENHDEFLTRCHTALADEFEDATQRHAVCEQQWRDRDKSDAKRALVVGLAKNLGDAVQVKPNDLVYQAHPDDIGSTVHSVDRAWSRPDGQVRQRRAARDRGHRQHADRGSRGRHRRAAGGEVHAADAAAPSPRQPISRLASVVAAKATKDGITIKASSRRSLSRAG